MSTLVALNQLQLTVTDFVAEIHDTHHPITVAERYEVQKPGLDRWSEKVDKAFINGDSAFTMVTDTMPRPYGPIADDLAHLFECCHQFRNRQPEVEQAAEYSKAMNRIRIGARMGGQA